MFLGKKRRETADQRIAHLERVVEQQGFTLCCMVVLTLLCTAFAAVLFEEKGQPDYDHIAVTLTVFQTLFGIAAIYGFWALRGMTRDRAEEVAEEVGDKVAREVAERVARELALPVIRREIRSALETNGSAPPISDTEMEIILSSLDRKDERDEQ